MNLDKPNETFRFAAITIAQVAYIFVISWPGQKLIDHSERIHERVYIARWYQASGISKKLLMLMMFRSINPFSITAGKLYTMYLENFSIVEIYVIRTSVSYFTVLIND